MSSSQDADRQLAWELHVELATRVASVDLAPDEGLLSEALASLHTVFSTVRRLLAAYPPATEPNDEHERVRAIGIRLLNNALRPFLNRWHPKLAAYEAMRPADVGLLEYERDWAHAHQLRVELADLQIVVREVAEHLATLAGAMSLVIDGNLSQVGRG